jgi:mannose-6-phosphate isomerase
MGTHPSVPSKNAASGETLRDLITAHPDLLGPAVSGAFGAGELPFLFKVLSIRKALSIQAHPDKALGAQLHAADPKNYPDDNHKPEMAIAVTAFEGFCGFRPLEQISALLESVPEFKEIIGGDAEAKAFETAVAGQEHAAEGTLEDKANRKALQALFSKLMNASADRVEDAARRLVERAAAQPETFAAGFSYFDELAEDNGVRRGTDLAHLIMRLNTQFPNDIGLFCGGLLLNYVRLYPGEAMFLRAKDPHAYISGDIIECMAASDNVVRAGFTPKFKDVDNLVSMLTYSYDPVLEQKMKPLAFPRARTTSGSAEFVLYNPPIAEFSVLESKLQPSATAAVEALAGPSILITTEGAGKISTQGSEITLHAGSVVFIAPGAAVEIEASERLVTYRAFVEVSPETKL